MMESEIRCLECGLPTYDRPNIQLCEECYKQFFSCQPRELLMPKPVEEEPDFVLENDVATLTISKEQLVVSGGMVFQMPKRYVFDPDARVKDYDKLILFLLENMTIYESAKGFDKVRYMFKEVE